MSRLGWALYASEMWHSNWRANGSVYAKARALVTFDRVLVDDHRIRARVNGQSLNHTGSVA